MKKNSVLLILCGSLLACDGAENGITGAEVPSDRLPSDTLHSPTAVESVYPMSVDSFYAFTEIKHDKLVYGFKNRFGETVIQPQFDMVGQVYHGLVPVVKGNQHGLCDTNGRLVHVFDDFKFSLWFNELGNCYEFTGVSEGFYAVEDASGKCAFINSRGELITDFRYDQVTRFSENRAAVYENEQWGYIDTNGVVRISPQYGYTTPFSEGLAAVAINDKIGFIDPMGNTVIPPIYSETGSFHEGLCWVTRSSDYTNYYYIDQTGKKAFDKSFEQAGDFENGEAFVKKRGVCRVIDKSGTELRKLNSDCFAAC